MAFESKNFIICSRFPLFRASGNLWMYKTLDTLESILADVDAEGYSLYFRPRENLKNHDSPNEGDVILMFVEDSKLAYLKVVGRVEKPYKIKVARTYLENESTLLALITELQLDKASKETDFATPITDDNLGITQAEQEELEDKIDLAANSGRMITPQGVWYAKMYSETVAPSAEDGTNYADFSQTDGQGNPIIVIYERQNGAWVQDQTITPPAEYDGYVPITSKIWDIPEQTGQQGGRILWNHTSQQFTAYPSIISFENAHLTGDSTVEMPQNPSDDNIASVSFVKSTIGGARNVGDVFFTMRNDTALNGAVVCDGSTYNTADYTGAQSVGNLLALGKIPYVSLATYATLLATQGSVGVFGWDGVGTTEFRVPSLEDIFIETGTAAQIGDYLAPALPNIKGLITSNNWAGNAAADSALYPTGNGTNSDEQGHGPNAIGFNAHRHNAIYKDGATVQPNAVRYRAMVQLATSTTDQAIITCSSVLSDIADLKNQTDFRVLEMPTADESNLGVIYQYTGETDADYTNGYFYKCVSDGQDPATYSWERVDVQPGGGSGDYVLKAGDTMTGALTRAEIPVQSNPVPLLKIQKTGEQTAVDGLSVSMATSTPAFYFGGNVYANNHSVIANYFGTAVKKGKAYLTAINNGADIAVPATGGTMVVATPPTTPNTTWVLKATVDANGDYTVAWVQES